MLTPDQQQVWAVLEKAVREGGFRPFLLHGVTGSGKTELYLRAIGEVVRQGKEALVLVPEISLTPQTIGAFQGKYGDIAVLHSHLQNADRAGHWRKIAAGRVQVVVGARNQARRTALHAARSQAYIVFCSYLFPSSREPTMRKIHAVAEADLRLCPRGGKRAPQVLERVRCFPRDP